MNKHRLNLAKNNSNSFNSITKNIIKDIDININFDDSNIEKRTLIKLTNDTPEEIGLIFDYIDNKVDLYKKSAKISNDTLYYYGMVGGLLDLKKLIFNLFKTKK